MKSMKIGAPVFGGRRAARPQGNRNLAAGRPWRADGQKVLLAVKAMGGESSDTWRALSTI